MYLKQKQNNTTRTWKNIKPYNKQGRLQHTPVQVSGTGVGSNMYTTLLQFVQQSCMQKIVYQIHRKLTMKAGSAYLLTNRVMNVI